MSQDLFEDVDCNADDPDQQILTPTEFSGVSATSSRESPASQATISSPQKQLSSSQSSASVVVSGAGSSPIIGSQLFCCPSCKAKLKTVNGFKNHLARHNIITDNVDVNKYLQAPVPTTSQASTSRASTSQSTSTASTSQASKGFFCSDCNKILLTESGFLRHRASHKLKDAEQRKPQTTDFDLNLLLATMNKIIHEILLEPAYGSNEEKTKFLEDFLSKSQSPEWFAFSQSLSDKICGLVCERKKKILPLNQYEECQQKLQKYLCEDENMINLSGKLIQVCNQQISAVLANRLVFRIALKLMWEIQAWVSQKTGSKEHVTVSSEVVKEMNEIEMLAFAQNLGGIIRDFYKKGLRSEMRVWQTKSACLCDKFVDGQHPISSGNFLDSKLWFSGDEDSIVPSENAVKFFLEVESAVAACSKNNTAQEVTDILLDNQSALNLWFHLTSSHFSEEQSLLFMKEMIQSFTRRSLLLKEMQKNRAEEKSVRATQAALRTHLKRNYSDKEVEGYEAVA